jgi:N-(2-amino-2-carboxyethyl)-L-glutamate synthase
VIVDSFARLASPPLFLRSAWLLKHCPVYLKVEGLNVAGSIKLKTATHLIDELEGRGVLRPGSRVIESSSGNLGLALALICAERHYPFTCVGDPNMSPATRRLMRAFGAEVIIVERRDPVGGFLGTRLNVIQEQLKADPKLVWTNQYANPANPHAHYAHYRTTGPELLAEFPAPDWVFIGTGTTGTAMGCARYLREYSPSTRIVGVDAEGSVTFGGNAGKRLLPGIGTSRRPELADEKALHEIVLAPEADAVAMCRWAVREHGVFFGPSTASVLVAIRKLGGAIRPNSIVIAICPDLGDRYIDTVYDDAWIAQNFPTRVA